MENIAYNIINFEEYKKSNFLFNDSLINDFYINIDAKLSTKKAYIKGIKRFITYCIDNNIRELPEHKDIIAYKEELIKSTEPTTATFYLTALKKFYQYLEDYKSTLEEYKNIINIAKDIKLPKINKEDRKDALTENQVKELYKSIVSKTTSQTHKEGANTKNNTNELLRNTAIFNLLLFNGLRTIEIERANIEDIRTQNNNIVLYIQGKGKDAKDDYIILNDITQKSINDYLATRPTAASTEPLFITNGNRNNGARLTRRTISYIIKEHLRDIGINNKRATAHTIRHTTATQLALNGADLYTIQLTLRHNNPATSQIYLDKIVKEKERAKGQEILSNVFSDITNN